jgi:hypothetical protein
MGQWAHGGAFPSTARCASRLRRHRRELLLRYCTREPLALGRLHELDPERLLYESTKRAPDGNHSLVRTPLALLYRLAATVPPPRIPCHRYFGVPARTAGHRKFPRRL